jgi:hypothetical protein
MRLGWMAVSGAVVALWASCLPAGPDDTSSGPSSGGPTSGSGQGGTPLPFKCEESCAEKYPGGEQVYQKFHKCLVCGACHDKCLTKAGCMPMDGMEKGCSAMAMSCDTCTVSDCAVRQKPDTTFEGACAAEATDCSKIPDCVAIQNCISTCIKTTGVGSTAGSGGGMAMSSSSTM